MSHAHGGCRATTTGPADGGSRTVALAWGLCTGAIRAITAPARSGGPRPGRAARLPLGRANALPWRRRREGLRFSRQRTQVV